MMQKIGVSGLGRQIARQQQQQQQQSQQKQQQQQKREVVSASNRSIPSSWADSMEQDTAAKTTVADTGNMEDEDDDIIEVI